MFGSRRDPAVVMKTRKDAQCVQIQGTTGPCMASCNDLLHADCQPDFLECGGASRYKVTPQSPFVLGSTSKSFTAMAMMQLVEAGKLDLDATVHQYLPWFELADQDAAARLTVRHLLTHTSGLSTNAYFGLSIDEETTKESVVRQLKSVMPSTPPGDRFQYSNTNYVILGLIVESVSGQTFERYIQEHIFQPLGMAHSFTAQESARGNGLSHGHQYLFGFPVARSFPHNPSEIPAGFIISSAQDMGRYLLAVMNGGQLGEQQPTLSGFPAYRGRRCQPDGWHRTTGYTRPALRPYDAAGGRPGRAHSDTSALVPVRRSAPEGTPPFSLAVSVAVIGMLSLVVGAAHTWKWIKTGRAPKGLSASII